jgi:hypothetical protein
MDVLDGSLHAGNGGRDFVRVTAVCSHCERILWTDVSPEEWEECWTPVEECATRGPVRDVAAAPLGLITYAEVLSFAASLDSPDDYLSTLRAAVRHARRAKRRRADD